MDPAVPTLVLFGVAAVAGYLAVALAARAADRRPPCAGCGRPGEPLHADVPGWHVCRDCRRWWKSP